MSERKDTDLQIQRGGGVYHFGIIMLYSQIFKQLLATQNQQVQTGRDWYNCIPSLAQSYSCSLPAALSEHLKGKKKKKKKKETNICLMMLWQGDDSNHASKAKLPKGQQKKAFTCSLHQPLHKGGQKRREMQCELPSITSPNGLPAACIKFRADLHEQCQILRGDFQAVRNSFIRGSIKIPLRPVWFFKLGDKSLLTTIKLSRNKIFFKCTKNLAWDILNWSFLSSFWKSVVFRQVL